MAFVGPITLVRRVIRRLNGVGWTRSAGGLAFTTLLGIVPLATVAFAFVAQFPVFEDFLRVLEAFLLRYMLPDTASTVARTYVVGLAEQAASVKGLWIVFVIVTAALVVDSVETEINEIWGIKKRRPILRRVVLYTIGVTAGPVLVGAAIWIIRWVLTITVRPLSLTSHTNLQFVHVVTFVIAVIGFTLLYVAAPARPVKWRHGFIGGLLAAAAFEVSRTLFAWYVESSPSYELLYGALAAVPIFMLWVFVFWMIVLAGAAVSASIASDT
ncbi:MAG: YihY family inner membrane protein [Burkholderiales bacterium]